MSILIHNTLSNKKEEFVPGDPGKVNMYVCGITPYDDTHLGHGRCYVVFDVIRRYLGHKKYTVSYVQNFTDIDDKIINRSKELNVTAGELAQKNIDRFFEVMEQLNIKPADKYPRVTEYVPQIIEFVTKLIEKGAAYVTSTGDVYFSVTKFTHYGKLSNRKTDELLTGVRIEPDVNKQNPLDFALWKLSKQGESWWDSPWGNGRPGWHIECSTMSMNELKTETVDIHGGGLDLVFPHHENEIAQSEALTGQPFARYWIHNGFVTINKEKMSKSLGNFFTLADIFKQYEPMVVRYFLLTQHYRTPIDFSDDKLTAAKTAWLSIVDLRDLICFLIWENDINPEPGVIQSVVDKFEQDMDNDFNTENAIATVFDLKNSVTEQIKKSDLSRLVQTKNTFDLLVERLLGLKFPESVYKTDNTDKKELFDKLDLREQSRKNKDWKQADEIRKEIESAGYLVEDTKFGARLKRKN
jgi:cysteinyl-tRNA synthetase